MIPPSYTEAKAAISQPSRFWRSLVLPKTNDFTRHSAFSLLELLTVMAIIALLSVAAIPALNSLKGAGNVNKSASDLSTTLELARTYAMANRTYVRVLLGQVPAGGERLVPALIAQPVFSADGTMGDMLSPDGTTMGADMGDAEKWPALGKALVLENLQVFDGMDGTAMDTSSDLTPMGGNAQGRLMTALERIVPAKGMLEFTGVVQFSPTGEARVGFEEPARFIKIAVDQPSAADSTAPMNKNPFILRLSGVNGSIKILRAGELTL